MGGDLNVKKLDLNAGLGTDLGILLANFNISLDNSGTTGDIKLKAISGIPDRNILDANHRFIYLPVVAADGKTWLNNNLGANYANLNHGQFNSEQQATAYNDYHAYGSLYQWGRYSDGHELMNYSSGTLGTPVTVTTFSTHATTTTPNNSTFYLGDDSPNTQDHNWLDFGASPHATEDDLWQGEASPNNPCPQGYRLPTEAEMTTLVSDEGITDYTNAASSSLAFTTTGNRRSSDGSITNEGVLGLYWSSTISGAYARNRNFSSSSANAFSGNRAFGFGVRCIQD